MAIVELILDIKDSAYLAANPTKVLALNEPIYIDDGRYAYGDGVTQLSGLTFFPATVAANTLAQVLAVDNKTGAQNIESDNGVSKVKILNDGITIENIITAIYAAITLNENSINILHDVKVFARAGESRLDINAIYSQIAYDDGVDIGTVTASNDDITLDHTALININAPSVKKNGSEIATIADIPSLSGYAPLASPTFTGTVILPNSTVTNSMLAGSIDLTTKVTGVLPVANSEAKIKGSATSGRVIYASATDTAATSTNMTYDGSTVAFAGTGSDILTITGSGNGSQRSGIRVNASNSLGQATNYMFNDRNATSSYGGQLYGGTTNVTGNLFGVSRVDKYFIFADGASNLGMCIGTLSAQPFILGTNNVERARFLSTGTLLFSAGTATAGSAPLKLTSGTNNTTAEPGAFEYNGTNLFFTRTGTTRENILVGNAAAAAPSTSAGVAIVNFYGTSATNFLGTPNSWASVVISGTTYKIPLYT